MQIREKDIIIRVINGDREFELKTYEGEYRNLMMLIYDSLYIEDFGFCRGMGKCGTCMVEIKDGYPHNTRERNEDTTITRAGVLNPDIRLACQIRVDPSLHNIRVIIWES